MNLDELINSLHRGGPPAELTPYLAAMWWEKRGDWERAHQIVQDIETETAALIHAYLHRREGDDPNARYWYSRAGRAFPGGIELDDEWRTLTIELLDGV